MIFENFLKFSKRRRAVPLRPIWTVMVAAKLDHSRVLVTKFHQNRLTLKGRSGGQRHRQTDRQTDRHAHRQTNSAENKGPSGLQSGQQTEGQTDGQNYDSQDRASIASRDKNMRVISPCWGEIWHGRVDFIPSVKRVAPMGRKDSKSHPLSNLNTGVCAARICR